MTGLVWDYFIYYSSFNIFGGIIFGIMLAHDRMSIDKQEKQLKYDNALIAFMLYFLSDSIWSGVDSGVFPATRCSVLLTDLSNYIIMTAITYTWLRYVMAVEQIPNRNKLSTKAKLLLPSIFSLIGAIVTYLAAPSLLLDADLKNTNIFDIYLVTLPYVYIVAVIIYTMRKAITEKNPVEKKKHLHIGLFPIMVVMGGLLQMVLMPELPIFCLSCTILMLIFYIQSMDSQISVDPLTKLSNRGQLERYIAQNPNAKTDGRCTYVMMIDINDFKMINDTYGHAEGDCALVILSQSLVKVVREHTYPVFLGRYGGDEFVLIAHPASDDEIPELESEIRECIRLRCESDHKPYILSVGIGYDKLLEGEDSLQKCMQRADEKLYLNKEYVKSNEKSTAQA